MAGYNWQRIVLNHKESLSVHSFPCTPRASRGEELEAWFRGQETTGPLGASRVEFPQKAGGIGPGGAVLPVRPSAACRCPGLPWSPALRDCLAAAPTEALPKLTTSSLVMLGVVAGVPVTAVCFTACLATLLPRKVLENSSGSGHLWGPHLLLFPCFTA